MFDGSLPEIADLTALEDAALVDAVRGWAQAENAACARKQAVMAELFARRTGLDADERELWWVDPEAAVTEICHPRRRATRTDLCALTSVGQVRALPRPDLSLAGLRQICLRIRS